jgi:hypothetical protein
MLTFVPIAFTLFLCFFLVLVTCVVLLFTAAKSQCAATQRAKA